MLPSIASAAAQSGMQGRNRDRRRRGSRHDRWDYCSEVTWPQLTEFARSHVMVRCRMGGLVGAGRPGQSVQDHHG